MTFSSLAYRNKKKKSILQRKKKSTGNSGTLFYGRTGQAIFFHLKIALSYNAVD